MSEPFRPDLLRTKDLAMHKADLIGTKVLALPDHPDWQAHVRIVIEEVMGPVHVGSLGGNKMLFVSVEPDEDGLHAKLELSF